MEHFERVSVVAMRRPQHNKIGNVHLKWAFSEGAVLFLRNNERGQRWHDKLVQRYGKAKVRFAIEFCALLYKWTNVEF